MHVRGVCHVYLAIDLGFAIDLAGAERTLASEQVQASLKKPRRAPEPKQFERRSLRINQSGGAVELGRGFRTEVATEVALWEFGAATFGYRIAVDAELSELVQLSDLLWDNRDLLTDARRRATVWRPVPRALVPHRLQPLSLAAVGGSGRAQAARARRHPREAREPGHEPQARDARDRDRGADRALDPGAVLASTVAVSHRRTSLLA